MHQKTWGETINYKASRDSVGYEPALFVCLEADKLPKPLPSFRLGEATWTGNM